MSINFPSVAQTCSVKKVFLEVSQSSQENTCAKRPWHWCFSVNVAKFLRTPFLTEQLRWLLRFLNWSVLCTKTIKSNMGPWLQETIVFIRGRIFSLSLNLRRTFDLFGPR